MNKKAILYGLIFLTTLSLTLGAVSASDFADETLGISLDTPVNDVQTGVSNEEVSYTNTDTLLESSNEDVLEISMNEDVPEISTDENLSDKSSDTLGSANEKVAFEDEKLGLELESSLKNNNGLLGYGEIVTTVTPGPDNVLLSNGYRAYCVNVLQNIPGVGTKYSVSPTNVVTHTYNNKPISNLVKLAIFYYSEDPVFQEKISHGEGQNRYSSRLQHLLWYLSGYMGSNHDSYYLSYLTKDLPLYNAYRDVINRDKSEKIPDQFTVRYNSTHDVTYDFVAFQPVSNSYMQLLMGYKKIFTEIPTSYEIQKVTITPKVLLNEQVIFELIYNNTCDIDLSNVFIVEEKWDDGLVYDSFIDNQNIWKHSINNEGKHVWTLKQKLPAYDSKSLFVVFNTTKVGNFTNYISSGDKTANNTTTVYKPDMEVNKISLTPTVKVGEQTLFMISVRNTGDVALGNVFVEENIPDGLTFADYNDKSEWTKVDNIFYYNGVLDVGEVRNFTIAFNTHVNGTFVNCVIAGSNETENKTTNNTTTVKKPGMDVSKKSLTPRVKSGEQTLFLISVWNTGELDLGNVFVKEIMPADLEYADYNDKNLWRKNGDIFYYNNVLKVGESANFTIIFNTNKTGSFTNCVIAGSNETENKTTENKTTVYKPDMEVTKISLTPTVKVGEQTLFMIIVKNTGDVALGNVFVEENIPDGLTFADYNDKSEWTKVDNIFYYNCVLDVGEVRNFTIAFNTHVNGTFVNCVIAGSNETEEKKTNNTTTVKKPGMDVNKKSLTPRVKSGEQTLFLISVWNTGELDLGNVFVKEMMPADLEYADYNDKNLWRKDGDIFYYNNVLKVGESANFTIIFNTNKTGSFTNCVIAGSNETENKTTENKTTVYKPDMEVTKISLTPAVKVGEQTLFMIIVSNTGDIPLTDVFVEENIPDGLTFADYNDKSEWTKVDNTFYYNGILDVGEVRNFTIAFNTHVNGTFVNCVIAGSNETEEKKTNNTTTVKKPDMEVRKISDTVEVYLGEQAVFTIVVKNTGELDLDNVFVEEQIPDGLTYFSYDGKNWNKIGDVFYYDSILAPGQESAFTIIFNTTRTGTFTNVVVAGSNETENKTTENKTTVYKQDLKVEKITITPTVIVGDQVTFEIVVKNIGETTLSNVFVEESSYDGLVFDHANYQGYWTQSTVNGKYRWTLSSDLTVGEVIGFEVVFNSTRTGTFTNVVVAGSNETENKTARNDTEVIEPKLDVEKITLTPMVHVGNQTIFEIVVKNTGTIKLTNVFVEETYFDDGITYDSWLVNGDWTYSIVNGNNRWTLNNILNPGEVEGFYVIFNTHEVGVFNNVVTAGADKTPNKTAENNTIVYNETPITPVSNNTETPNLDVQKIALEKLLIINDQGVFEIIVHNTGDVELNDVTVSEVAYDGLKYASWYDYSGLWRYNNDYTWTLNNILYPGEYANFFVVFDTTKTGEFTNYITAKSDKTPEKPANDTIKVVAPALSVEKITINRTVNVGEQVMFEILVQNTGNVVLNDVKVTETSFNGLKYNTFVDHTGNWKYNNDLTWTYKNPLNIGEYAGFFVVFDTSYAGDFINVVAAESKEVPSKNAENNTKVVIPEKPIQPVIPEEPVPEEPVIIEQPNIPEEPVPEEPTVQVNETPEQPAPVNKTSTTPKKSNVEVLPATGNPLLIVLLTLIALGAATLRRRK